MKLIISLAAAAGLCGCVAYPAGYYGGPGAYYGGGAYYDGYSAPAYVYGGGYAREYRHEGRGWRDRDHDRDRYERDRDHDRDGHGGQWRDGR